MDLEPRHRHRRPWALDDVRALFASRGCILLDQEYTNTRQTLRYRCANGHEYSQRFDHFRDGHGCMHCRNDRRQTGRIDLDSVLLSVEDEGFTDVQVQRHRGRIRIAYTCAAGHRTTTARDHFLEGKRCRACSFSRQRGAGNPRYNPSLTDEDRSDRRHYDAYAAWRGSVFARDGYACRKCAASGRINAHHVVNYSSARELRTVVSNGVTLCVPCHREFHAVHGYRDNNAEQLRSFLGGAWV